MFASALGRTRDSITDESHGRQAAPRRRAINAFLRLGCTSGAGNSLKLIFANEHARADVRLWPIWGLARTILLWTREG